MSRERNSSTNTVAEVLWHFVAEIRSQGTPQALRRAYAKSAVPRIGCQLLNRRPGSLQLLRVQRHAGNSVARSLGWQGSMQHLYVQQGAQAASGLHGSAGGEALPGAMPLFFNVTLVGGHIIGVLGGAPRCRGSIGPGVLLEAEAGMNARHLLAAGFASFALDGSAASFVAPTSSVASALLANSGYRHGGSSQVRGQFKPYAEYISRDPDLLNVRYRPKPDPRPHSESAALRLGNAGVPPYNSQFLRSANYVGAIREKNWIEQWTFFGPESAYEVPVD